MLKRMALIVVSVAGLITCSCNSLPEKNPDGPAVNTSAGDEFSVMEAKLLQDSLNVELRTMLAVRYYSAAQLSKAAVHFLEVYKQDSLNLVAIGNLGNIYYDSQQDEKAIEFYEKALAIDPGNLNIKCDLATCYSNVNKYKRAISLLEENIKMDPLHAKSHHNLAVILKKSGDEKNANKAMQKYNELTRSSAK